MAHPQMAQVKNAAYGTVSNGTPRKMQYMAQPLMAQVKIAWVWRNFRQMHFFVKISNLQKNLKNWPETLIN